jgi:hypothetical protein
MLRPLLQESRRREQLPPEPQSTITCPIFASRVTEKGAAIQVEYLLDPELLTGDIHHGISTLKMVMVRAHGRAHELSTPTAEAMYRSTG